MAAVIVDTNVPIVANAWQTHAGPDCVLACIDALERIREESIVLLDYGNSILDEYRHQLSPTGQPGAGDSFYKWLWDNQGNVECCLKVQISATADRRSFEEFPKDPDLSGFDEDDHKFVATAVAYGGEAPIMNASDRDWWEYLEPLERNGLRVQFLCPELMRPSSCRSI